MSEPRRWTLHGLTSRPYLEGRIAVPERIDPPLEVDEVIEVMLVSEHQALREAVEEYMLWEPGRRGHAAAQKRLREALNLAENRGQDR